jgi:hypothetical protein
MIVWACVVVLVDERAVPVLITAESFVSRLPRQGFEASGESERENGT